MNDLLIICATKPEWSPLKKWLFLSRDNSFEFPLWVGVANQRVSLLQTGIGPERVSLVLKAYLNKYPAPVQVLNAGLCGGLNPKVTNGDLFVISTIHHEDKPSLQTHKHISHHLLTLANKHSLLAKEGSLLTSTKVLEKPAEKKAAFETTGATVVDMEAYVMASLLEGIPFGVLKAVFDSAHDDVGDLSEMNCLLPEGSVSFKNAATGVIRNPKLIKSLPVFQKMASRATTNLSALIKLWVESGSYADARLE